MLASINSKNIEIPTNIAEGIKKYQKFSSKKDSSSSSSSSIVQTGLEHSIILI